MNVRVRLALVLLALLPAACDRQAPETAPPAATTSLPAESSRATPTTLRPGPADVVALVTGVLTGTGERHYYGGDPEILDKAAFQAACPNDSELTLVLGCYHRGTISILRIDRPELSRLMEVTAAHEMLHAAHAALGAPERRKVHAWIEEFYAGMDDAEVRELVAEYERLRPQSRLNELHSILATEVEVLSPDLETYYGRYFTDRGRVVQSHESYRAVLRELTRRVDELHVQIDQLNAQLGSLDGQMKAKRAELDSVEQRLGWLEAQGSIREFNALIPRQNALVNEYNGLVDRYNELVDVHDAKVEEVNALALKQDELASALGSRPSIPPAGGR